MALICPKCGRSSDEIAFIEAFCVDDYPIKLRLPEKVELERCTRCERIRLKGEWTRFSERKISDLVLGRCRGDFDDASYDMEQQKASFRISQTSAVVERSIPLEFRKTICEDCSRMSGGYYEGIIQLRGDRMKMAKYASMFIDKLGKSTFIAKTEEKEEGIDLYVGSSKAVVAMMSELKLKTLITKKLVGREQGKRLYRTTFLIRL